MATYVDPVVALLLSEHVIQPVELDWKAKNETWLTVEFVKFKDDLEMTFTNIILS